MPDAKHKPPPKRPRGRPVTNTMPEPILEEREITLPPRDYQPSKAEVEQQHDMPGADIVTVRSAFFRRVKVRETSPKYSRGDGL